MGNVIEISDFSFCYRGAERLAVDRANLVVPEKSFVGIAGAAGSGKTTLASALCGVVPHCQPGDFYGSVRVCGMDVCDTALVEVSRAVGSVRQDVESQFVATEVVDEILYGLENFGVPHGEIMRRVDQALDDMGISDLRGREIATLSGGQKQKVAIASVLALDPRLIVLDEPTAELDPMSARGVYELLARCVEQRGASVVVIEQDVGLLARFADLLAVMDDGRIVFADEPARVLAQGEVLERLGVECPRCSSVVNRLFGKGVFERGSACTVEEASRMVGEFLFRRGMGGSEVPA